MSTTLSRQQPSTDPRTAVNDTQLRSFADDLIDYSMSEEMDMVFEFDNTSDPTTLPSPYDFAVDHGEAKSSFIPYGQPSFYPNYELGLSPSSPTDSYYESSGGLYSPGPSNDSPAFDNNMYLPAWNPELESPATAPISIPSSAAESTRSLPFVSYGDGAHFPGDSAFSPSAFSLHSLPSSASPSSSFDDSYFQRPRMESLPMHIPAPIPTPAWSSSLWEMGPPSSPPTTTMSPSVLADRPRNKARRGSLSSGHIFLSSSAPSFSPGSAPSASRPYSRRAESVSVSEDRDATVRRRRKISTPDDILASERVPGDTPTKSALRPPKLAPSAWQLYFTDWIQRQQTMSTRKLNVAQAAKEAGQEYACLTTEEKEPYKQRSQAMKEAREREHNAYMRTLTPDDIKKENAFRAAQRKAGKSRKSNIKDPNAPKKPLSAYFMFLQRIRAHPQMVADVFGEETETTKQSVLAAAKWRSMSDDEKKPFLAQAEQEKMEYETARRIYEDGSSAIGMGASSFNFSILPGSPLFTSVKVESDSEGEGAGGQYVRS